MEQARGSSLCHYDLFDEIKPRIRCEAGSIWSRRSRSQLVVRARLLSRHRVCVPDCRGRSGTEVNRDEQWFFRVEGVVHGGQCHSRICGDDDRSGAIVDVMEFG